MDKFVTDSFNSFQECVDCIVNGFEVFEYIGKVGGVYKTGDGVKVSKDTTIEYVNERWAGMFTIRKPKLIRFYQYVGRSHWNSDCGLSFDGRRDKLLMTVDIAPVNENAKTQYYIDIDVSEYEIEE